MTTTFRTAPTSAFTTDRLFRDLWTVRTAAPGHATANGLAGRYAPGADVYQDGDDLVARFDLPGINPADDVTVEVEGRTLVVRGERKDQRVEETEGQAATRRVREVRFGEFRRVITLPKAADADAVSAAYDAGVLTITVTGVYAGTTPQRIEVTTAAA